MKKLFNYFRNVSLLLICAMLISFVRFDSAESIANKKNLVTVQKVPNIQGAWKLVSTNGVKEPNDVVSIFSPSFTAYSTGAAETGEFIAAGGGFYNFDNDKYNIEMAFSTQDSSLVGTILSYDYELEGDTFTTIENGKVSVWQKIDNAGTDLNGNWRMLGRPNSEGVLEQRRPVADRVTIKILSGTRFQWAAINTGTKQFMGTGAGTYTIENGTYTEKITVFSRNKDRVGAVLPFNYRIQDGDWYHSGNNSSGEPMAEVWAKYER